MSESKIMATAESAQEALPRVVVLGAGFAGLTAVKALAARLARSR